MTNLLNVLANSDSSANLLSQGSADQMAMTHVQGCGCSACCSTSADFSSDGTAIEEDFSLQSSAFRWQQPNGKGSPITITYSFTNLFDGGIDGSITNPQMKSAIEEALELWAQYAPIEFVEVKDTGEKTRNNPDGADMRFGHENLGGRGGTLGRASLQFFGDLATKIAFDNRDTWGTDQTSSTNDFLAVAVHEIGHALGLRHESAQASIMRPTIRDVYDGLGSAFLYNDDINGIRALYGSGRGSVSPRSGGNPSPGPTPNPSPTPNPNPIPTPSPTPKPLPVPNPNQTIVIGTNGNDILRGNGLAQTFKGRNGNDRITAGGGDDRVIGGKGNDSLFGEAGNDRLLGSSGNDNLSGGAGNDRLLSGDGSERLNGVNPSDRNAGLNERDILKGGLGADTFVLGDRNQVYYNDGRSNTTGIADYAMIRDFRRGEGDKIQLNGTASNYRIGSAPRGGKNARGIFLRTPGDDELIAIVQGDTGLNLNGQSFNFV